MPIFARNEMDLLVHLRGLSNRLSKKLSELGGRKPKNAIEAYTVHSLTSILVVIDGYIRLRADGALKASRFLVRPAIELMFNARAAENDPTFLYKKAHHEIVQDAKLVPDNERKAYIEKMMREVEASFSQNCPELPREIDKNFTVEKIAKMAGFELAYNKLYRAFCQYTHGSMRSIIGDLDEGTGHIESELMCLIAVYAIRTCPNE